MANHTSYMLDNMITAVDAGFSYDGIVSVPETSLEDVGHRFGLASSLRDKVVGPLSNLLAASSAARATGSGSAERGNQVNSCSPRFHELGGS
jgi:hypothetical protein